MNPFKVLDNVQNGYRRYAESFQNFTNNTIRNWIDEQITSGDLLWKEPYIELVRGFRQGAEFEELNNDRDLNLHPDTWKSFGEKKDVRGSEPYPLYKHQEEAIKSVLSGNNTIIATGTGSGKTYCFMVPIVSRSLELKQQGKRGIKALIIYPMNALANSQYNEMAARLAGTGLKIALYTGDTEYSKDRAREEFRDRFGRTEPYDSELVSREQIQTTPPDILMTNYQMLEFILTRREDQELFPPGSAKLEYLVLDEVHTYSGTQGADVACLIRRLKEHVGVKGSIRCIGTSATIQSETEENKAEKDITRFAEDLFGEPFASEHVIRESRLPFPGRELTSLPEGILVQEDDLNQEKDTDKLAIELSEKLLGSSLPDVNSEIELGEAVYNQPTLAFLERKCERGSVPFEELVEEYQDQYRQDNTLEECKNEIIAALIVGSMAEEKREGRQRERFVPKVHAFFSQGRSVVSCLSEDGPHLSDRGENVCKQCDEPRPTFPLYFCSNCGQEYYAVRIEEGKLKPAEPGKDEDMYYLYPGPWDKDKVDIPDDWIKDGKVKDTYNEAVPQQRVYGVESNEIDNKDDPEARVVTLIPAPFQLCLNCGIHYTKRPSEFRKLFTVGSVGRSTGTDVMVSSMLEETPEDERKTIVFSDNRQDTALQSSHMNELRKRLQFRRALNYALKQSENQQLLLTDAGYAISEVLEEFGVMQNYQKGEKKYGRPGSGKEAWANYLLYVLVEDLEKDTRRLHQDLEDCGLMQVDFYGLEEFAADEEIWGNVPVLNQISPPLREDYLRGILRNMQDYLAINSKLYTRWNYLQRHVLSKLDEKIRFDKGKYKRNPVAYSDVAESSRYAHVKPFSSGGLNAYLKWTREFLNLGTEEARDVLSNLFELLQSETEYLSEHENQSDVWLLNPNSMILKRMEEDKSLVCVDCGRVHWWNTEAPCYRYSCSTGLKEVDFSDNYFFLEYEKEPDASVAIMAAEHSGQLSGEERQKIEQRFEGSNQALNVIVCTPTMELGIDIGDLSSVVMRNIPPNPSNYAQRSGRAGRDGQPALILNFCGSGPGRGPHDQYFYRFPEKIISGMIRAPRFLLENESLITAHLHSLMFELMDRKLPSRNKEILDFKNEEEIPIFQDLWNDINDFIEDNKEETMEKIKAAFSREMVEFDWFNDEFIETTVDSFIFGLDRSYDWLRDEYRNLQKELDGLHKREKRGELEKSDERRRGAVSARLAAIRGDIPGNFYPFKYLASQGFLPNYAFPKRSMTVSFSDRKDDMPRSSLRALSEMAPGNTVYLRGERYMIRFARPPKKDGKLDYEHMKVCQECGHVYIGPEAQSMSVCPGCGAEFSNTSRKALRIPDMYATSRGRITAQEEERQRRGYEIENYYEYDSEGTTWSMGCDDFDLRFTMDYESQGDVERVNLGIRPKDPSEPPTGFHLCTKCNKWLLSDDALHKHIKEDSDSYCPEGANLEDIERNLVLYSESKCDVLSIVAEPGMTVNDSDLESFYWSLAYALKNGITFEFDLEEGELGVFVLDNGEDRRVVIYEAEEGGLGVLKELKNPEAFNSVLERSLELMHVGEPEEKQCKKACYDCLLSFYNQRYHSLLDRKLVIPYMKKLKEICGEESFSLKQKSGWKNYTVNTDSDFEEDVLGIMKEVNLRPPDEDHKIIPDEQGTPIIEADFFYEPKTIIMVDGSPHYKDYIKKGDEVKRRLVKALRYEVIELTGSREKIKQQLESIKDRLNH